MSIGKEINAVTVACDKTPLAQRGSLWAQAWECSQLASVALKQYRHVEARNHLRSAKHFLKAHKEQA